MSGSLPIGCFFELQTKPERQYLLSSPPFVDAQSPTVASGEWGQSCQRLLFLEDAVRSCRGPTARCTPVSPLKIQLEEGEHPSSGEEDPGAGAALGSGHASSEPAARPIPRFVPIPGFAPGTLKPPTPQTWRRGDAPTLEGDKPPILKITPSCWPLPVPAQVPHAGNPPLVWPHAALSQRTLRGPGPAAFWPCDRQ